MAVCTVFGAFREYAVRLLFSFRRGRNLRAIPVSLSALGDCQFPLPAGVHFLDTGRVSSETRGSAFGLADLFPNVVSPVRGIGINTPI